MDSPTRARIRAGDPDEFGLAFDAHANAVFRFAVRHDGDRAGAEDVVSLTFLEAWRLRGTLHPDGGSLLPWLLGIATNVLRNRRRAARRHRAAMLRLPPPPDMPDFADEVADRMRDTDRLRAAAAALRRLRRTEREVFMLCVWSHLEYTAAAEALGIPVGTVRSRLSRARTKLRRLAEAELAGSPAEPTLAGPHAAKAPGGPPAVRKPAGPRGVRAPSGRPPRGNPPDRAP